MSARQVDGGIFSPEQGCIDCKPFPCWAKVSGLLHSGLQSGRMHRRQPQYIMPQAVQRRDQLLQELETSLILDQMRGGYVGIDDLELIQG